jgi:hypothetical protein
VTQQFNVTREVQQQIAQTMLQARASLRRVEESIEALEPLAHDKEIQETLRVIKARCHEADGNCHHIYKIVAAEAFKEDNNAKETT